MPKEQSLAEFLELIDPEHHPPHKQAEEEALAEAKLARMTPKQFCKGILQSPEFRTYIMNGITLGEIPSAIMLRIMDEGWGPMKQRLEIRERTDLVDLTPEQVAEKLQRVQRMLKLVKASKRQDADAEEGSVH